LTTRMRGMGFLCCIAIETPAPALSSGPALCCHPGRSGAKSREPSAAPASWVPDRVSGASGTTRGEMML
jgi:hypothetical protein